MSTGLQVTLVDIADLHFDRSNPRLMVDVPEEEDRIVQYLYENTDLTELIQSISQSGFLRFEPLIVLRDNEQLIVLEGNRRLAAAKLLNSLELQQRLGIALSPLAEEHRPSLEKLAVFEVPSREAARPYIGFKHINGPHKWDALAKAKYAAKWLKEGGNISTVSKTFGDTHNTVRRQVFGWLALQQAEANGFGRNTRTVRRFAFSHLYTALERQGYRLWLALSPDPSDTPLSENPIPSASIPKLRILMGWLYGDKDEDKSPILKSQNPDLNQINDILLNDDARSWLINSRDLREAYKIIQPLSRQFGAALLESLRLAKNALSLVPEWDGDESLLDNARSLNKTSSALLNALEDQKQQ